MDGCEILDDQDLSTTFYVFHDDLIKNWFKNIH